LNQVWRPIYVFYGVFRRYHVEGNPVNQIDPEGLSFKGALRGAAKGALYGAGVGAVLGGTTGLVVGIVTGPGVLVTTVAGAAKGAFEMALVGALYGSIRGALDLDEDLDPCLYAKGGKQRKRETQWEHIRDEDWATERERIAKEAKEAGDTETLEKLKTEDKTRKKRWSSHMK
jgi:hypothetical protein